jgi:hypothetical protein
MLTFEEDGESYSAMILCAFIRLRRSSRLCACRNHAE